MSEYKLTKHALNRYILDKMEKLAIPLVSLRGFWKLSDTKYGKKKYKKLDKLVNLIKQFNITCGELIDIIEEEKNGKNN